MPDFLKIFVSVLLCVCDYIDEPKKFILNCFGILNIFKAQVLSSLISPYWLPNCVRIKECCI